MGKKCNRNDIIKRFQKVHKNKWIYDRFEYYNMHTKSIITCPIHGDFMMTPHAHLKGQGCPECGKLVRIEKKKDTTESFIEKAKSKHNNEWLDYSKVNYVDSKTKVCIICHKKDRNGKEHGEFWQKPGNHLNDGNECPKCAQEIRSNYRRLDKEEFIRRIYDIYGDMYNTYKIKDYVNNTTPVTLICKKHGEFTQKPMCLLAGKGCPQCGEEKRLIKINNHFKNIFEQRANEIHHFKYDYTEVDYKGTFIPVKIICPIHGEFWQKPTSHLSGYGCQQCAKDMIVSSYERVLREFIKGFGIIVKYNNRTILKDNKELDIYLPNNKLAIEFDGLYWHNEINKSDCKYHLNKTLQCADKGIQLIHIFEDEWIEKLEIVKSRLMNILGLTPNKIYARKCEIREVDYSTCKKFLDECHIQGNCPSKYRYGLFYNNELVSVMTFGGQRKLTNRKGSENDYELLRFCNKLNTTVIGGAGKLLKHFIKKHNPSTIISYADRRWSSGNMYEQLGFTHIRDSKPNYFYVVGDKRENRFNYRKDILIKEGYDANKTEHEIMLERKIYRIYDCGCLVYEMKLNKGISE